MQLIAIGNNIINLDNVTVLDFDPVPNSTFFVVHVHSDSNQPVIDITVGPEALTTLLNLVPQQLRINRGTD